MSSQITTQSSYIAKPLVTIDVNRLSQTRVGGGGLPKRIEVSSPFDRVNGARTFVIGNKAKGNTGEGGNKGASAGVASARGGPYKNRFMKRCERQIKSNLVRLNNSL